MNDRMKELIEESGMTQYVAVNNKYLERLTNAIIEDLIKICEEEKEAYLKLKKSTMDFGEKNIYAEGESASDRIKIKVKRHFK